MGQTTIQITKETREKLKRIGKKGQTYNDIIEGLLEIGGKVGFFKELDRIADHEEFFALDEI